MYFVGVDSGGTKTSFVLADDHGRILARRLSGGGRFLEIGADGLRTLIADGVTALCAKAGVEREQIMMAGLGFPGYGEQEGSEGEILAACEAAIGAGRVVCECDSYLGWAGSLAMQPGINVVAGTGSICYGVNEAGASARSSGWGVYCDEGSCRWIGERVIQLFTRQSDGRMPRTALYDIFKQHFGIDHDLHFIGPLNHELGGDAAKVAQLQRLCKAGFDAGDPHAKAIYDEAADELWLAIRTTVRALNLERSPFRVSYSGGLFRAGACILDPLRQRIEAAGGTLVAPRFEPEEGAVLMAMRSVDPQRDFSTLTFR